MIPKKILFPCILLLMLGLLVIGGVFYILKPVWLWEMLASHSQEGAPQTFVVQRGLLASAIAKQAEKEGLVSSSRELVRWLVRLKADRHLKPGEYQIRPGMAYAVAKQFAEYGNTLLPEVRILPGMTFENLLEIAPSQVASGDFFQALSRDANYPLPLLPLLPLKAEERILFLLPETYRVPEGPFFADEVVQQASRQWWRDIGPALEGRLLSSQDCFSRGVLASVVEREAFRENERAAVAGVFLNRISRKMPLQSCATVVYAWSLKGIEKKKLLNKDLAIDSPYNTYRYPGLPPGPICIPSQGSWMGALYPEDHDYLYFVARGDGSHVFSKTYQEHLRAKQKASP
ncbi:MAG TPA: endolytic transglycosylase MltG [Synergistaceae bacterium]|nr:endolytic transglycosylase MltG [Synergistaceae bacterium]